MSKDNEYNPLKDGVVVAIRIYGTKSPRAVLAFAFGGIADIEWDVVSERVKYEKGINAYTYVFDERPSKIGRTFESFIREK